MIKVLASSGSPVRLEDLSIEGSEGFTLLELLAVVFIIGLSLALKATAVGLLVAIPCVVMNNVLRRRVSELLTLYKVQHGS